MTRKGAVAPEVRFDEMGPWCGKCHGPVYLDRLEGYVGGPATKAVYRHVTRTCPMEQPVIDLREHG
jgi:hypothetical protein